MSLLAVHWCRINGWSDPDQHIHMCYSDFSLLFTQRGLSDGLFPFVHDVADDQVMEYPVLIAVVAGVLALLVPGEGAGHERVLFFYDLNHMAVVLCWMAVVIITAFSTAASRRRDALMVALAPGIILTLSVNWDMWAVFLGGFALLLWGRGHSVWAGILLGLGAAMKLYPLFFLGAILVLCLRAGRLRSLAAVLCAGIGSWLAVNVPFMITQFDQWATFYRFSSEREVSFSSMWLAFSWLPLDGAGFSVLSNGLFLVCCLGIAYLGWAAPVRPRVAQLCFLIVASFILLGKVYSPQFVMWLIPLAVLAYPRLKVLVIWQAAEVFHWAAVWMMSAKITSGGSFGGGHSLIETAYGLGIAAHMITVIWLMVLVVGDILHPHRDAVRQAEAAEGRTVGEPSPESGDAPSVGEDPLAGTLRGRRDAFTLPGLGQKTQVTLRW
nr:glycosyltransferase 87 family protein [Nesterenkonia massiliensis]